jgi:hypothetical protein
MLNAIGGGIYPAQPSGGDSISVLSAQLARYQVQLADWENCPSCKTPEGKAKIADLTDKISSVKQRLKSAELSSQETNALRGADRSMSSRNPRDASSSIDSTLSTGGVGSLVNAYA